MSKWGSYAKQASGAGGGGGGLFLKIESGAKATKFLVPEKAVPHCQYKKWSEGGGPPETVDGPGDGVSCRILLPVVLLTGEPKILEMPAGAFADLAAALDDEEVGGSGQIYRAAKTGQGLQTRWKIDRLDRATPEQLGFAKNASLPDLSRFGTPMAAGGGGESTAAPTKAGMPSAMPPDNREPGDEQPDEDIPF